MGSVRKEVYEVGSGRSSGVLRACMGRMRLVMTPEAAHGNRLCLQKKQFASSSIRMTSVKTGREREATATYSNGTYPSSRKPLSDLRTTGSYLAFSLTPSNRRLKLYFSRISYPLGVPCATTPVSEKVRETKTTILANKLRRDLGQSACNIVSPIVSLITEPYCKELPRLRVLQDHLQ